MKNFSNNHTNLIFNIFAILKVFVAQNNNRRAESKIKSFLFLIITSLCTSSNVFSAAGDPISSTATLSYVISGVPTVAMANVTFVEDRRINFVVTEANGGLTVPVIDSMLQAVIPFVITNTGNDTQDFLLASVNALANPFGLPADNIDPVVNSNNTFVESGATPGYQLGQDVEAFVDELAPNASRTVYIVSDMLATIVVDDVAAMLLIAQVAEGGTGGVEGAFINADDNGRISPDSTPAGEFTNSGTSMPAGTPLTTIDTLTMETVFNDPAGLSPEDWSTNLIQDVAGNGQHSDAGAYQVRPPVNIVKTVTVIDTLGLGGADPHPGSTLRYQIDVTVEGSIAIDDLVIRDAIPANTTYTALSITLNGVSQTDINDAPGTDFTQTIGSPVTDIEVDLGEALSVSVAPGATNTIIFEVTID